MAEAMAPSFMEERCACRAIGVAAHDHGAIADVREQHRRDIGVVLDQRALGDAEVRPEKLTQVRQPHLAAVDFQYDVVDLCRNNDTGCDFLSGFHVRKITPGVFSFFETPL